jgi:phytol kinase
VSDNPEPSPAKRLLLFAFVWLMVGFSSGTTTLIGPVGWVTQHARGQGWPESSERSLVIFIIVLYVAVSALVCLWLTRAIVRSELLHVKIGVLALVVASAGSALWLWLTPEVMGSRMPAETRAGSSFTFGPYPTEDRLAALERDGYTAVISLLHPAVVPFEPKLIADETAAAERVGIEFIHLPMLPWIADNTEAMDRIETIAREGTGRYYVHCYLGKDRVRMMQRIVEEAEGFVESGTEGRGKDRVLEDGLALERGEVVQLADGVFLTPYPTDDEFQRYVVHGDYGRVVSLLDPEREGHGRWIERERTLLEGNRIHYSNLPLSIDDYDPRRAIEIAEAIAEIAPPAIVHAFLSPGSGRGPAAEALVQAYRSGLPPLPPSLFLEPMQDGTATVVAPNVAVGPHPAPNEFGAYLRRVGVRRVVYLGSADDRGADVDREACRIAGLPWEAFGQDADALIDRLADGGPWYLYGPSLPGARGTIAARLGPAIPDNDLATETVVAEVVGPTCIEEGELAHENRGFVAFLRSAIPGTKTTILVAPGLLLFTAVAAGFAGWLRCTREVRAPYTRKTFHFAIFTTAAILHLAGGLPLVALFGSIVACAVLYAVWRGTGFPFFEAMARPTDAPRQKLFILVPLATTAIGGLLANLFFGPFAYIGYLVGGWGDAVGEPVGTAFGRHRYRVLSLGGVPATRSLEGSAAVLIAGALVAVLGLLASGVAPATALGVGLACAVVATVVEAFSNHGLDNLTIQLAAAGTAFLLLA